MAGIQIGSVSVAVVPSAVGFTDRLRAQLIPEADKLGVDLGTHMRAGIDAGLKNITANVKLDISGAMAQIAALRAAAAVPVVVTVTTAGTPAAAAAGAAGAGAAGAGAGAGSGGGGSGSTGAIMANTAALTALTAATIAATSASKGLSPAVAATGVAAAAAGRGFGGFWGILRGGVGLFGTGATAGLFFASTLMIVVHGVIELLAVLIPAVVALTVFGAVAAGVVSDIVTQMTNMHTVVTATGQAMGPFTGGLQKLQDAVRPQVYQLFGDVLTIVGAKTGMVGQLATATGKVLDVLGARFTVAASSAKTMTGILAGGPPIIATFGDIFANMGSIIGTFLKAVPGYAVILLNLFDVLTHGIAVFLAFAEPVLAVGLAFHGAFLYIGLAVTAIVTLLPRIVGLGLGLWNAAFAAGATSIAFLQLAASEGILEAATLINPYVWVAVAAVAIGALVYLILNAKSATQQWTASLQKALLAIPVNSALSTILSDQVQVTNRLTTANQQLSTMQQTVTTGQTRSGAAITGTSAAYTAQKAKVDQLTSATTQLSDEASLFNYRIGVLGSMKGVGGATAALGLLNVAGITTKQMLDLNAASWAVVQQQVAATVLGYKTMGIQAGALGNDLQVLNIQATDQYKAMQTLNSGLDTFIKNATSGTLAFDTFGQGLLTMATNSKVAGASMGGLNAQSLTLNASFGQSVINANAVIDTLRVAGVATNLQTQAVKDSIAPMISFAKGNQAATAQLVALAQEAGYNGPVSLKALTTWLGNTTGATRDLQGIVTQATIQESLLSGAMRAQGSYIANTLIGDINNAILKYDGVRQAATDYGNAVAKSGQQSDAAHSARVTLINDLIKAGTASHDTQGQIAAMIAKVLSIPLSRALQIVMDGTGKYSINGVFGTNPVNNPPLIKAAAGIRIPGYGGGDVHPALLEGGETVVSKEHSALLAPIFRAAGVPGYAGGGLIETGAQSVLNGSYAVQMYNMFGASFENAMVKALGSAVKAADAAATSRAAAAAGGPGVAGPGGGNALLNAILARSMMPAWANGAEWAAWDALEMSEAGWNQFARNPSSGAYGIPQALPPGKMGAAANPPQSNPHAQISWMIGYIKSVYGDPINAEAHERNFHWYDAGGVWEPGTFGMNGLDKPEAVLTPDQTDWLRSAGTSGASGKTEKLLERIAQAAERAPAQTGAHVAGALNGTARGAVNGGIHSGRGGW